MDVANEILDAIEIIVDKKIRENTVQIYPGVCKSVSGNTCVMSINGRDNTVQFYGSTPTVGTIYRVFVPNGNMSMAFIIAINDDSSSAKSASIFVTGLSQTDTVTATNGSKTKSGVWTQIPNPAIVVPAGYTQLEYIESTGTQYIDAGYKPKTTTTVKTRFYSEPYTSFDCPFGCRTTSTSNAFLLFTRYNGTAKSTFNHGNSENWISTDNMYNKWLDVSTDASHLYMRENNNLLYTLTFNGTAQDTEYNLFLFNLNEKGSIYSGNACATKCKMSYFQTYENDTLVRNFIPCKRNSDNAVGMYDLVTNEFFGNSGTGTFTAGPEVPQTIDGFLIDKIKDYGTWTITATNGTKTATQDVLVDSANVFSVEIDYKFWLYKDGDECEEVTGGWTNSGYTYGGNANGAAIKNSDSLYATTHSGNGMLAGIVNPVDVTNYSTLFAEVMRTDSSNLFQPWIGIASDKSLSDKLQTPDVSSANVKEVLSIDITSLTGNKYVAFVHSNASYSGSGYAYKIWLE